MEEGYLEFEMAVTSGPTYLTHSWISRYETQVESGSHMPVNGVAATGPDGLLLGGRSNEGREGQCKVEPGPSALLALAQPRFRSVHASHSGL